MSMFFFLAHDYSVVTTALLNESSILCLHFYLNYTDRDGQKKKASSRVEWDDRNWVTVICNLKRMWARAGKWGAVAPFLLLFREHEKEEGSLLH